MLQEQLQIVAAKRINGKAQFIPINAVHKEEDFSLNDMQFQQGKDQNIFITILDADEVLIDVL